MRDPEKPFEATVTSVISTGEVYSHLHCIDDRGLPCGAMAASHQYGAGYWPPAVGDVVQIINKPLSVTLLDRPRVEYLATPFSAKPGANSVTTPFHDFRRFIARFIAWSGLLSLGCACLLGAAEPPGGLNWMVLVSVCSYAMLAIAGVSIGWEILRGWKA